eukprot:360029-Chlamydomonas_euryale.AAC.6
MHDSAAHLAAAVASQQLRRLVSAEALHTEGQRVGQGFRANPLAVHPWARRSTHALGGGAERVIGPGRAYVEEAWRMHSVGGEAGGNRSWPRIR